MAPLKFARELRICRAYLLRLQLPRKKALMTSSDRRLRLVATSAATPARRAHPSATRRRRASRATEHGGNVEPTDKRLVVVGFDNGMVSPAAVTLDVSTGDVAATSVPPGKLPADLHGRLARLADWAKSVAGPDVEVADVAIEAPIVGVGAVATIALARASAALALGVGSEVRWVDNATVKRTATGRGNASKAEVLAAALERWPGLASVEVDREAQRQDIADAAWVAECCRVGWLEAFGGDAS